MIEVQHRIYGQGAWYQVNSYAAKYLAQAKRMARAYVLDHGGMVRLVCDGAEIWNFPA